MFRGKESLNRIELSRLVQDLLNFGVLGSLWLWGWGGAGWMGWGVVGGAPHKCAHACVCTHTHACVVNMIIPCKWLPPLDLGKSQGFPMMSYVCACTCTCVHVCAFAHVWGGLCHHPLPPSTHPPPPGWGTLRISQNSIVLELIEIFQFCLKI